MNKFLAVVKREYVQRVRTKMFIVATILGPLVMSLFGVIPAFIFSIEAGGPVTLKPETIADGTTAPFDPRMFELLKECVDRWLLVPEPRLRAAIPQIAANAKVVAEGAGALAYAALEQLEPGPTTVAVVSGGNIDPTLLASLLS